MWLHHGSDQDANSRQLNRLAATLHTTRGPIRSSVHPGSDRVRRHPGRDGPRERRRGPGLPTNRRELATAVQFTAYYSSLDVDFRNIGSKSTSRPPSPKSPASADLSAGGDRSRHDTRAVNFLFYKRDGTWRITSVTIWPPDTARQCPTASALSILRLQHGRTASDALDPPTLPALCEGVLVERQGAGPMKRALVGLVTCVVSAWLAASCSSARTTGSPATGDGGSGDGLAPTDSATSNDGANASDGGGPLPPSCAPGGAGRPTAARAGRAAARVWRCRAGRSTARTTSRTPERQRWPPTAAQQRKPILQP